VTPSRLILGAAFCAAVLILAGMLATMGPTVPGGDMAMTEVYTLHATGGIWPLGPYSRYGWHHPGPMLFYLLAPGYVLSGHLSLSLHATAALVNVVSLSCVCWVLWRHRRERLVIPIGMSLVFYAWRAGGLMASAWNPHVLILPLVALIVTCAALAIGDAALLPAVLLVASFVVQSHISLAPTVASVAGVALCGLGIRSVRRRSGVVSWRKPVVAGAGVLALAWSLPLWEELRPGDGNITKLLRFVAAPQPHVTATFAREPGRDALTLAGAAWADMVSAVLLPERFASYGTRHDSRRSVLPGMLAGLQIALLLVAGWWCVSRGEDLLAWLLGLGLLALLTGLAAAYQSARIEGMLFDHIVFWLTAVGALNWGALLAVAASGLQGRPSLDVAAGRTPAITTVIVLVLAVLNAGYQLHGVRRRADRETRNTPITALAGDLADYLRREGLNKPVFRFTAVHWYPLAGLGLDRYKRGIPFAVPPELVWWFGGFPETGEEDVEIHLADWRLHEVLQERPGDRLIGHRGLVFMHALPLTAKPRTPARGGA
jgi:hypothetical protein